MTNARTSEDCETKKIEVALAAEKHFGVAVASGLFSGTVCAAAFNPWDRALYLSVVHNRPFLRKENFKSPYHGFQQAAVQRAFLGGIYYILQGEMKTYVYPHLRKQLSFNEFQSQLSIGITAGCVSGMLTNGISAIKYHTYGDVNRTFSLSAKEMWRLGGYKPFLKAIDATAGRDMIFGGIYETTRKILHSKLPSLQNNKCEKPTYFEFLCNGFSAALATIASGPLNYVRNIKYGTPPELKPPTITKSLVDVWEDSKLHKQKFLGQARFFQQQFRVGWGTARVAAGMAVGQIIFDATQDKLNEAYSEKAATYKK